MKFNTFNEFEDNLTELLNEKKYAEALNLIDASKESLSKSDYEKNSFSLMFYKAYIHTLPKNVEGCITAIKDILANEYSLPMQWPRYDFLKEHSDYDSLRALNDKNMEALKKNSQFKYEVHLPDSYDSEKKHPLFFCLHGDGFDCNKASISLNWKKEALLEKGYVVVYPQSSQMYCYNGFGWLDDPALSRSELKDCYDELLKDYSIDENRVLAGGFSGGATAVIDLATNSTFPLRGVIALCPGDYLDKLTNDDGKVLVQNGTKVFIMDSENADPALEHIVNVFKESSVDYKQDIIEGMGHAFPEDFNERLMTAEDFIIG